MGVFVRSLFKTITEENKITTMKWLLALISVAVTLFVITQGKALSDVPPDAECLLCVDDIVAAIDHCTNATTPSPTMECIEYALGAASDCIRCVLTSLSLLTVAMVLFATKKLK